MKTFRGKYSLLQIEAIAGDFDRVLLVGKDAPILDLPAGHKRLVVTGYRWPCGCVARGHGDPDWAKILDLAACSKHGAFLEEPVIEVPPDDVPLYDFPRADVTGKVVTVDEARLREEHSW